METTIKKRKSFSLILSENETRILKDILNEVEKCISTGEIDCEGELIYANSDNFILSVVLDEVNDIQNIIRKLNK